MRTTITLDDDVAARLEQIQKESGRSFKATINELLRIGIIHAEPPKKEQEIYRTPVLKGSKLLVNNVDNVAEVIATVEGDAYK